MVKKRDSRSSKSSKKRNVTIRQNRSNWRKVRDKNGKKTKEWEKVKE